MEAAAIREQGCNVFENDTLFGEIRDITNNSLQFFHVSTPRKAINP
jgi:hypothetical protein